MAVLSSDSVTRAIHVNMNVAGSIKVIIEPEMTSTYTQRHCDVYLTRFIMICNQCCGLPSGIMQCTVTLSCWCDTGVLCWMSHGSRRCILGITVCAVRRLDSSMGLMDSAQISRWCVWPSSKSNVQRNPTMQPAGVAIYAMPAMRTHHLPDTPPIPPGAIQQLVFNLLVNVLLVLILSKAPKGNGIGATGSKNWVWF